MHKSGLLVAALAMVGMWVGPGCARRGPDFDLVFFDTMTAHHEWGLELAQVAELHAMRPELRDLARRVADTETRELPMFKDWRDRWYAKQPKSANLKRFGLAQMMKDMDAERLQTLPVAELDRTFARLMVPYQRGAAAMAREALKRAKQEEVRSYARTMVEIRGHEAEMLERWIEEWGMGD